METRPKSASLTLRLFVCIVISTSILFVIVIFKINQEVKVKCYSKLPPPLDKAAVALEGLCRLTRETEKLRRYRKNIEVNPARQVVEELLQIVTKIPENLCKKDSPTDKFAVVIVDSARMHLMERNLIRETWGSVAKYRGWNVRTVFLLGQSDYCISPNISDTNKVMDAIKEEMIFQKEIETFSDLVVGSFADTYKNMTYKHLMGYKFVLENCPHAEVIIKTDDDAFVDIPKFIDMREEEIARNTKAISDIYCHHYHDKPTRCQNCLNAKYFSTKDEWPEDTYPPYCLGGDFIISKEWAKKIFSVRHEGGFFWVDDVFITGKLKQIAVKKFGVNAKQRDIRGNVTNKRKASFIDDNCEKEDDDKNRFGIFVFFDRYKRQFQDNMKCLWNRVLLRTNGSLVTR